ncbi:MAG TPA: hypothetical protein VLD63_14915 [Anaerolineales bacterium]|nr:hypothetical protein [Anaerolineales bacterium]
MQPKRTSLREPWLAVGLVLAVALLAYAPLLGRLGFYRDDWYQLWAGDTLGPRSLITLFSIDRPAMGYLYAAAFSLLRDTPLAWQVYSLALRTVGALAVLWLTRRLWPRQPLATTSVTLLFLVYPGFLQQPNADTFSNHLFGYTSELISIAATVEALRSSSSWQRAGFTALAILSSLGSWLTYEYMIGLEVVRFLLIARHFWRQDPAARQRWGRSLTFSLPFLLTLAAFLIYRLWIFQAARPSVVVANVLADYRAAPLREIALRALEIGKDTVEAVLLGWAVPTYNLASTAATRDLLVGLLLAALAAWAFVAYARSAIGAAPPQAFPSDDSAQAPRELILVGMVAVVAAITPVVLTGRDIRWTSAFDRYTLHATLGIGLLVVGLLFRWLRPAAPAAAVAFLLGLSVFTHFQNATAWARFWDQERQFWWQLTWRAPGLEPGTVLLATLPSQRYFEDYEVWGPANLIYEPGQARPTIASEVLEELTAAKVRLGAQEVRSMRVLIDIPRDYRLTLIADWPSTQACVHVLDREQLEFPAAATSLVRSIGRYSDAGRVVTEGHAAVPPGRLFGPEPPHDWCWYYQTASLLRQRRDWEGVARLGDEAERLDLKPRDPTEWMPFFEASVNLGHGDTAQVLAARIGSDDLARRSLCDQQTGVYFRDEAAFALGRRLLCGGP